MNQISPIAYIITPDFNSDHIEELVEEFSRNSIPYTMQKEVDTLGQPLDKRYFVVVDNIKGAVVLGSEFSSLLMFIVGYPRKGPNKKNHYAKKISDVVGKYRQFCNLPEPEKTNFTTYSRKTKSQMKTIKSLPRSKQSSTLLHNRSQSVSNSIKQQSKMRSHTNVEENPKIFLMRQVAKGEKDKQFVQYNKMLSKIAVANPSKYKIVDNFNQLESLRDCGGNGGSCLLIHEDNKLMQNYKQLQKLQILVYSAKKTMKKTESNVKFISSYDELLSQLQNNNQIMAATKYGDENRYKLRKNGLSNEEKGQQKSVLWANEGNQSFKTPSSDDIIQDSKDKNYSISQNQIGEIKEKLRSNTIMSRTEPGRINNFFAEEQQKKIKALQELQKEYVNTISNQNQREILPKKFQPLLSNEVTNQLEAKQSQFIRQEVQKQFKKNIQLIMQKVDKLAADQKNFIGRSEKEIKQRISQALKTAINTQQPKKSIRKIKRIKSQDKSLAKQNPQKLLVYNPKVLRRNFVLPQEYFSPISPATVPTAYLQKEPLKSYKSLRPIKRMKRCYSQEPEVKYIGGNQMQLERVYRILPIQGQNNVLVQPRTKAGFSFVDKVHTLGSNSGNWKKSQVFLSTNGTETEGNLFIDSKYSQSDSGFLKAEQKSYIIERKQSISDANMQTGKFCQTFTMMGTFGNLKPSQTLRAFFTPTSHHKESIILQSKAPALNKIYNSSYGSFPQSRASNISQTQSSNFSVLNGDLTSRSVAIVWKQFNFDIEQTISELNKRISESNMKNHPFYLVSQLEKVIKIMPSGSKIILMLDDTELNQYLSVIERLHVSQVLAILVFPRDGLNIQCQNMIRANPFHKLVKIVQTNNYFESSKLVAKKTYELIAGYNRGEGYAIN